jgi:hypothetical protein
MYIHITLVIFKDLVEVDPKKSDRTEIFLYLSFKNYFIRDFQHWATFLKYQNYCEIYNSKNFYTCIVCNM